MFIIVTFAFLLWIGVLLTNTEILIAETKVDPGQDYFVSDYGNLGDNNQSSLVCKYFNGRKILTRVLWYSPNDIFGRSSCLFINRDS